MLTLQRDTMTPELQRLAAQMQRPRAVLEAGAKTLQVEISRHLRRLQARGNVKGWPPQKFFAGKATSVEKRVGLAELTDVRAVVTIADPRFVHRITGGRVTAKRAKYLAIPLTAEAYAKAGKGSIRESMPGLKVIQFKRGLYLCRETSERRTHQATGSVKRARLFPLFKLVRSVTHRPHPEEMPNLAELSATTGAAMLKAARLLLRCR